MESLGGLGQKLAARLALLPFGDENFHLRQRALSVEHGELLGQRHARRRVGAEKKRGRLAPGRW